MRKVTLQHLCFCLSLREACREKTSLMDGCICKRMECETGHTWHLIGTVFEVRLPHGCTCRLSSFLQQVMLTKQVGWQRLQNELPACKVNASIAILLLLQLKLCCSLAEVPFPAKMPVPTVVSAFTLCSFQLRYSSGFPSMSP